MSEEKLKEAFLKIREDISILGEEISDLRANLLESTQFLKKINEEIMGLKLDKMKSNSNTSISDSYENNPKSNKKFPPHNPTQTSTHPNETSTHPVASTQTSTHPKEIGGWKTQNLDTSIGNDGVSTDRQTDRQTIRHIFRQVISKDFDPKNAQLVTTKQEKKHREEFNVVTNHHPDLNEQKIDYSEEKPFQQQISEASEILNSLDTIKKEIRKKFKKITKQELLVFSTIYSLEEQDPEGVDYRKVAIKLHLSESSIRDYTQRMISKGIPITKEKVNNKKILLHIAPELKKIATLNTIIQLREL